MLFVSLNPNSITISGMFFEADLHTDRLSANKQRTVGWDYRNLELCPMELLPGFAFHQTTRAPLPGQPGADFNLNDTRTRDFVSSDPLFNGCRFGV